MMSSFATGVKLNVARGKARRYARSPCALYRPCPDVACPQFRVRLRHTEHHHHGCQEAGCPRRVQQPVGALSCPVGGSYRARPAPRCSSPIARLRAPALSARVARSAAAAGKACQRAGVQPISRQDLPVRDRTRPVLTAPRPPPRTVRRGPPQVAGPVLQRHPGLPDRRGAACNSLAACVACSHILVPARRRRCSTLLRPAATRSGTPSLECRAASRVCEHCGCAAGCEVVLPRLPELTQPLRHLCLLSRSAPPVPG
jgi:hypothetical protein